MEKNCSENSACTWSLGVCIEDPEDIAEFERNFNNPTWSEEALEFYKHARDIWT